MRVLQRYVSALHVGHLQVVIRLVQLNYNAWNILGIRAWGGGLPWSGYISGVVIGCMSSPYYY